MASLSWLMALTLVLLTLDSYISVVVSSSLVTEDTFLDIKNSASEQFVIFYHGSDLQAEKHLKIFKKAAKKVIKERPGFRFRKCDGDLPINKKEFEEATFHSGSFFFTSTPFDGIEKYVLDVSVKSMVNYIRYKYMKYNEDDVLHFTDEDDFFERMDLSENPKPIFVKFYEQWCQHCKKSNGVSPKERPCLKIE